MSNDAQQEQHTGIADVLDAEVTQALGLLQDGFDRLLEISDRGDLCGLGPARLIEFAQQFEQHRSRLTAIDTGIIEAAHEERLDSYTCSRNLPTALADLLRISRPTAKARVARAEQLMPQNAFSLGVGTAQLPLLAHAVRSGTVTGDQVNLIGATMRTLRTNSQIGLEELQQAEQILITEAATFGPEQLRVVAAKLDEVLLPDGVLPREATARERRGLRIGSERRDGTHSITGSLTRSAYARIMSVLSSLAAPRPADDMGPDPRTAEQRLHDALEDAASRLLDSAGLPRTGGTPATVHITVDAEQFLMAVAGDGSPQEHGPFAGTTTNWAPTRGTGTTSFGDRLTFAELVQLAEQAQIIPVYLSATNGILAYGAQRRCATPAQTQALIARDKGCSFPACDAPAEWCERHHVIPWYRGGPTDLNNLTLLCGYHHREFEKRGWQVVILHGLPVWIPPVWIDREQKPRINTRIRAAGCLDDLDLDPATVHAAAAGSCASTKRAAYLQTTYLQTTQAGSSVEPLDDLDPIPELIDLLALHITDEEREEFKYDLDLVLDSYIGPNAPARHLEPVA